MDKTESLVVDCGECVVRSTAACQDCIVSVLLGMPGEEQTFDAEEISAIEALADAGLVPPLRLVRATDSQDTTREDMTRRDDFPDVV